MHTGEPGACQHPRCDGIPWLAACTTLHAAEAPTERRSHDRSGSARRDVVPLREATRAWFAISLQTFGGPAGQIAVMQHKLVDEKRWIALGLVFWRRWSTLRTLGVCALLGLGLHLAL